MNTSTGKRHEWEELSSTRISSPSWFLFKTDNMQRGNNMAKLRYLSVEMTALGVTWNNLPAILTFIFWNFWNLLTAEVKILQRITLLSIPGFMRAQDQWALETAAALILKVIHHLLKNGFAWYWSLSSYEQSQTYTFVTRRKQFSSHHTIFRLIFTPTLPRNPKFSALTIPFVFALQTCMYILTIRGLSALS